MSKNGELPVDDIAVEVAGDRDSTNSTESKQMSTGSSSNKTSVKSSALVPIDQDTLRPEDI